MYLSILNTIRNFHKIFKETNFINTAISKGLIPNQLCFKREIPFNGNVFDGIEEIF